MQLIDSIKSTQDNVYKLVYKNNQQNALEVSVIRKNDGKDILCVPTQTSCNMGCSFCHLTPLNIKAVNLTAQEIVELVNNSLQFSPPENPTLLVSYMGAGEPLLNVEGVIQSALQLQKLNYKTVRFGVSTLIPGQKSIKQLTQQVKEHQLPIKLHYSLHSTKNEIRKSLMPSAMKIEEGLDLVADYIEQTKQPAEIHYTLMKDINDTQADIDNLSHLVDKRIAIKLLKFAPHDSQPSLTASDYVNVFKSSLERNGFIVESYAPPGASIGAACGMFVLDQYAK